jgi:hypothetical protein
MAPEPQPLAGPARWAVIALIAVIASDVVAVGSDLLEVDLMQDLIDGKDVSTSKLDADDYRQIGVSLFVLAVYIPRSCSSSAGSVARTRTFPR